MLFRPDINVEIRGQPADVGWGAELQSQGGGGLRGDDLREQEGQFNDLEPTRDVLRVLEVRRRWNYRLALLLFWSQNLESDCEASGDLCFQV